MKVCKYKAGDVFKVKVQPAQYDEAKCVCDDDFLELKAFSVKNEDDEVLGVFGFRVIKKSSAECFALLGVNFGAKMLGAIRLWRRMLERFQRRLKVNQVFITVKCGFKAGERLAFLLGFNQVKRLNAYFNGIDYQLFERN